MGKRRRTTDWKQELAKRRAELIAAAEADRGCHCFLCSPPPPPPPGVPRIYVRPPRIYFDLDNCLHE